jgi:two-component system cell cycle response regulator DivK
LSYQVIDIEGGHSLSGVVMNLPQGHTVLVVDDYEDERAILKQYFEGIGYDVCEAGDGEEAVRVALLREPDLILMDIGLPERSGISATYKILKNPSTSKAVVIAVTGYSTPDLHQDVLNAGCAAVLVKPVSLDALRQALDKYLEGRG